MLPRRFIWRGGRTTGGGIPIDDLDALRRSGVAQTGDAWISAIDGPLGETSCRLQASSKGRATKGGRGGLASELFEARVVVSTRDTDAHMPRAFREGEV